MFDMVPTISMILRSSGELIPWLALILVIATSAWSIYLRFTGPLGKVPSIHWLAPWTRYYNLYIKYFFSIRTTHYEAHVSKHGCNYRPVVRVGPMEVSIMTTEGVRTVFGGGFERSPWYSVFANFGQLNMFSFKSGQAHAKRKRIFASAYSKTSIAQHRVQDIIKSRVGKLTNFIESQTSKSETSHGSEPIVVRHLIRALQADIFTAFAFSDEEGSVFLDNVRKGSNTMEELGMGSMDLFHDDRRDNFFFWESETPFKYIGRFMARNRNQAHATAQQWLLTFVTRHEAKAGSPGKLKDFRREIGTFNCSVYDKLLYYRHPETGKPLEQTERASEVMDHAIAGQDAVSAALEFIIRQISAHANVQSQLRLELLTSLPLATDGREYTLIDALPYLDAVVMESLRLVDTISSYQTRIVPKGGCEISGFYLPAGTTVVAQPYIVNRQPDIFPSPNTFNPSRWLLPRDEYRTLSKSMWTYSSGPRSCIGRGFSLAIIKTVLVDIYIRYATTLQDPDRTEKRPWEGADRMAEVRFENVLACDEGEWIEKRVRDRHPSNPASNETSQHHLEEPFRRQSISPPKSPSSSTTTITTTTTTGVEEPPSKDDEAIEPPQQRSSATNQPCSSLRTTFDEAAITKHTALPSRHEPRPKRPRPMHRKTEPYGILAGL